MDAPVAPTLGKAWLWTAGVLGGAIAGIAVGQVLASLLGVEEGESATPLVGFVVVLVVLPFVLVPAAQAWRTGHAVADAGDTRGKIPAYVAAVMAGWVVLTNVVGLVGLVF